MSKTKRDIKQYTDEQLHMRGQCEAGCSVCLVEALNEIDPKELFKKTERYRFCFCTTLDCTHKTFIYGRGIVWHERGKNTL